MKTRYIFMKYIQTNFVLNMQEWLLMGENGTRIQRERWQQMKNSAEGLIGRWSYGKILQDSEAKEKEMKSRVMAEESV